MTSLDEYLRQRPFTDLEVSLLLFAEWVRDQANIPTRSKTSTLGTLAWYVRTHHLNPDLVNWILEIVAQLLIPEEESNA